MAVKNLGILTLDLVKELTQSENNKQEDKVQIDSSNPPLKDRFLALTNQENGHLHDLNPVDIQYANSIAAHQSFIANSIIEPVLIDKSFKQVERQRMEKMSRTSAKISEAFRKEQERKEKLEQDRHDQLIAVQERSNNMQALTIENTQLRNEIEKLKLENVQLKKIKENLGTKESDNVLKIVAILADMAGLPKANPSIAYNMMEAHSASKGLEIPASNTVTKWFKG